MSKLSLCFSGQCSRAFDQAALSQLPIFLKIGTIEIHA